MATIGLYDIDFNHGGVFNLNIPLMKAYNKLYSEGHQVIFMKPLEKQGRYNKILYFKDNPNLIVPKSIVVNREKSKFFGYGFLKESGLAESTKLVAPSFTPYDLNSNKIKNKTLYSSIKINSLLDWREKDFTGCRTGAGITYVNDRDFLLEPDWKDLFSTFDNNIKFVRTVNAKDYQTCIDFLKLDNCRNAISIPPVYEEEKLLDIIQYNNVCFDVVNEEQMFLLIFAVKILCDAKISFNFFPNTEFQIDLQKWGKTDRVSFKDFKGNGFNTSAYINFPYRLLLKQNPKKITYNEFKTNWLT